MLMINETHDVHLTSWVSSANTDSDFPIQNLPFAIFKRKEHDEAYRGGVAIGDQVLDLAAVANGNIFSGREQVALQAASQS